MIGPSFLIIGAMKAGTTALSSLLEQHPQIFVSPVKEPNFYAYYGGRPKCEHPPGLPYPSWIVNTPHAARRAMERRVDAATFTTVRAYETLWQNAIEPQTGEASVRYLYLPQCPELIARLNPDVKLIVILRDPVERAYSHYLMARRMSREPIASFAQAIEAEAARLAQNYDPFWHYFSFGKYFEQLTRYFRFFEKSKILILFSDDMKENLSTEYARVLRFLGVDDSFRSGAKREYGVGGVPRSKLLYRMSTRPSFIKEWFKRIVPAQYHVRIMKRLVLYKPELEHDHRQQLRRRYSSGVASLEGLIEIDLSHWRGSDS